jgi:hypothetical protein
MNRRACRLLRWHGKDTPARRRGRPDNCILAGPSAALAQGDEAADETNLSRTTAAAHQMVSGRARHQGSRVKRGTISNVKNRMRASPGAERSHFPPNASSGLRWVGEVGSGHLYSLTVQIDCI